MPEPIRILNGSLKRRVHGLARDASSVNKFYGNSRPGRIEMIINFPPGNFARPAESRYDDIKVLSSLLQRNFAYPRNDVAETVILRSCRLTIFAVEYVEIRTPCISEFLFFEFLQLFDLTSLGRNLELLTVSAS